MELIWEYNLPQTNYFVDGYCASTKTVYEFLGCYYHGCRKCFINSNFLIYENERVDQRYNSTKARLDFISNSGYQIVHIWECEFKKYLSTNVSVDEVLDSKIEFEYSFIDPRDAVYGGRTETFKLYHKTSETEKIKYLDFTSLYPYVNKYCKNPIKHPIIVSRKNCKDIDLSLTEGFIRCKILPPKNLRISVSPYYTFWS